MITVHESQMRNMKKNTDKTHLIQFQFRFIFYNPLVSGKKFTDKSYPPGYFHRTGTMG